MTVLIVGLGIAGLTAAIECRRKGFNVIGFEKKENGEQLGDVVGISGNSVRILAHWKQGMSDFMDEDIVCAVDALELHDIAGTLRGTMPYNPASPTQGHLFRRTGLLAKLYQHAICLGVDLRFGVNVTGYWEDAESAGIHIGNSNEKVAANCVIAADGFHSTARRTFTSERDILQDNTQSIGTVIYRSIFDAREIADVPEAQWILRKAPTADIMPSFYGKDIMLLMGTAAKGRYVTWACSLRVSLVRDRSRRFGPR